MSNKSAETPPARDCSATDGDTHFCSAAGVRAVQLLDVAVFDLGLEVTGNALVAIAVLALAKLDALLPGFLGEADPAQHVRHVK